MTGTACWSTASGGSPSSSRRTTCPPIGRTGTPQQQLHLDLWVDDLKAAHEKAISLGARLLKPADDPEAAEVFQVYADPAGHPFCLCWHANDTGST